MTIAQAEASGNKKLMRQARKAWLKRCKHPQSFSVNRKLDALSIHLAGSTHGDDL